MERVTTKEFPMAKYLINVNYVGEGIKGLLKEGGTSRQAAAAAVFKSAGGNMDAMFYAFGDTDCYVLATMPDNASMAAVSLTLAASGMITGKTTVLMTPEEMD